MRLKAAILTGLLCGVLAYVFDAVTGLVALGGLAVVGFVSGVLAAFATQAVLGREE